MDVYRNVDDPDSAGSLEKLSIIGYCIYTIHMHYAVHPRSRDVKYLLYWIKVTINKINMDVLSTLTLSRMKVTFRLWSDACRVCSSVSIVDLLIFYNRVGLALYVRDT